VQQWPQERQQQQQQQQQQQPQRQQQQHRQKTKRDGLLWGNQGIPFPDITL